MFCFICFYNQRENTLQSPASARAAGPARGSLPTAHRGERHRGEPSIGRALMGWILSHLAYTALKTYLGASRARLLPSPVFSCYVPPVGTARWKVCPGCAEMCSVSSRCLI